MTLKNGIERVKNGQKYVKKHKKRIFGNSKRKKSFHFSCVFHEKAVILQRFSLGHLKTGVNWYEKRKENVVSHVKLRHIMAPGR